MAQGRFIPQVQKHLTHAANPRTTELGLWITFVLYITSRSKLSHPPNTAPSGPPAAVSDLCPDTSAWRRSHARAHKLPTTPGLSRGFPTPGFPSPEGDQHLFFGKIFMCPGPYSSGTATATFQSSLDGVSSAKAPQEICTTWNKNSSGHPEKP